MMLKSALLLVRCAKKHVWDQVRFSSQALSQLSSEKYNVTRKDFATLQSTDVNFFKSVLSDDRVLTDENDVLPFNIDWLKNCRGQSKMVLKPKTTREVSQILSYCNKRRLAICPQGGNTGVVGASVPVFDEIILNMGLMNKIISLDDISGALVCETGCILEVLDKHVQEHGLIMPLDLGAKGSCHIGGNINTNAGGQRLIRYGNLHGSLLGIEAVKADGTVIDCLRSLKKDNTGYHLKHLFVGSEGTLGIVTKLAIHCPVLPKAVTVGFFGLENFDNVLKLFKSAKSSLGEILSAYEMMDNESIRGTLRNMKLTSPIPEYPFYVLMETHGSDADHDTEKVNRFLSKEMDTGLILNGTVATEPGKIQAIWKIRESIPAACMMDGYVFCYDVSLPLANYYQLVPMLRERLGSNASVIGFGHIGDGNIHINVTISDFDKEVLGVLEPFIFEEVSKLQGSVSAEHGIGFRKPQYIHYSKDRSALGLMRDLKTLMDPNGILNPYKVLPDDV
ncbi:D-2-hydroxyglutarate dehydrogenase, mitochondrial isoform X3 [Pectinophora gossypiella]|uniref:D-2-hydroxyglutarate dehydrogenase, mitochondrial isoform X3 n=1 Tax=Pectinophora gossypiella TaxID=13191 RepID=UPI00214F0F25|nr:D-2-hydroxyglutarate dehydrogenase, mitochondrial isoform X3 [Pectinophora gossypiella]